MHTSAIRKKIELLMITSGLLVDTRQRCAGATAITVDKECIYKHINTYIHMMCTCWLNILITGRERRRDQKKMTFVHTFIKSVRSTHE